jgi:hypothetical protein
MPSSENADERALRVRIFMHRLYVASYDGCSQFSIFIRIEGAPKAESLPTLAAAPGAM